MLVYLSLFVDDGLLYCNSSSVIAPIINLLIVSQEFDIIFGDAQYFVGLQINRNREFNSVFILQNVYMK